MILLDTCAILWLNTDRSAFSAKALKAIGRYSDALAFSPASVIEVGIKYEKDKLELPLPPARWFLEMVKEYSLIQIPLNLGASCAVTELPPIHNDPFDRMIIATAKVNNLPVATSDTIFPAYPGIKVIW